MNCSVTIIPHTICAVRQPWSVPGLAYGDHLPRDHTLALPALLYPGQALLWDQSAEEVENLAGQSTGS